MGFVSTQNCHFYDPDEVRDTTPKCHTLAFQKMAGAGKSLSFPPHPSSLNQVIRQSFHHSYIQERYNLIHKDKVTQKNLNKQTMLHPPIYSY
jgi:hypothetical protein